MQVTDPSVYNVNDCTKLKATVMMTAVILSEAIIKVIAVPR